MIDDSAYNDIRPYRDHEFREVIDRLLGSSMADQLIKTVFPDIPVDVVKAQLKSINTSHLN